MAESKARLENVTPWKKDERSGRFYRFGDINGTDTYARYSCACIDVFGGERCVQWDHEKGSVLKCKPAPPVQHNLYAYHQDDN
jgi:hypothetical protein